MLRVKTASMKTQNEERLNLIDLFLNRIEGSKVFMRRKLEIARIETQNTRKAKKICTE